MEHFLTGHMGWVQSSPSQRLRACKSARGRCGNISVGDVLNGEELKNKVRAGGVVYGSMISMGRNARWTTPIDDLGLDYVIIDTEHSPRSRAEAPRRQTSRRAAGPGPAAAERRG